MSVISSCVLVQKDTPFLLETMVFVTKISASLFAKPLKLSVVNNGEPLREYFVLLYLGKAVFHAVLDPEISPLLDVGRLLKSTSHFSEKSRLIKPILIISLMRMY